MAPDCGWRVRSQAARRSWSCCSGVTKDEVFNKKARVGPIWINVDKVHVTGPPSLFLRFSSEDVHTFLDRQTIDAYALDELSIRNRMHIRTEHGLRDPEALKVIGDDYLDLKKKDGSYRRIADRVHVTESGNGEEHYSLEFGWPKLALPGSYQVEVYACRDGRIVGQSGSCSAIGRGRASRHSWRMPRENHAYGYGILAVILAVIAGFGIDALAVLIGGAKKRVPAGARPALRPQPAHRAMAAAAGAGQSAGAGAGWRPANFKACSGASRQAGVRRRGSAAQQRHGAVSSSGDAGARRNRISKR